MLFTLHHFQIFPVDKYILNFQYSKTFQSLALSSLNPLLSKSNRNAGSKKASFHQFSFNNANHSLTKRGKGVMIGTLAQTRLESLPCVADFSAAYFKFQPPNFCKTTKGSNRTIV